MVKTLFWHWTLLLTFENHKDIPITGFTISIIVRYPLGNKFIPQTEAESPDYISLCSIYFEEEE